MHSETLSTLLLKNLHHPYSDSEVGHDATPLAKVDWSQLIDLASQQKVAPLLYHRLKTANRLSMIPEGEQARLKKLYQHNAIRNLKLRGELYQVLQALQTADIPVIVLKGAYLAHHIYLNPALRWMVDIDLLVPEDKLVAAQTCLGSLGYTPEEETDVDTVRESFHHLPCLMKPGAITIEIHWHIVSLTRHDNQLIPLPFPAGELWERAQPIEIAKTTALALSKEDLLLHLCLHAALHHNFEIGIHSLCDLDLLIRHHIDSLDWDVIVSQAHRWKATRGVYLIFSLLQELLHTDIPQDVLEALRPSDFVPEYLVWAKGRILDFNQNDKLPWMVNLGRLRTADTLQKKAQVFFSTVFPSRTIMARLYAQPASSNWVYLYYVVRIKDLLVRYSTTIWQTTRERKRLATIIDQNEQASMVYDWMHR